MRLSVLFSLAMAAMCVGASIQLKAQATVYISPGMNVSASGVHVTVGDGIFANDGIYTDTTGTFDILGSAGIFGVGSTTVNDLVINNTGSTVCHTMVSVRNTFNIAAGSINANDSIFLRSDLSAAANMVVTGVLTGTVRGLATYATVTSAPCPSYTSDLSTNVSGPVVAYQWQQSADSLSWTNIPGATTATYTATVLADGYYRCHLTTTNSTYDQSTPGLKLVQTGVPAAVAVSGAGPHCGQVTLAATGGTGGSIYFQGSTPLGTSTAVMADTALITASGVYYFRSMSAAGCWGKQDSAVVTITPYVTPSVSLTSSLGLHTCQYQVATFTANTVNGGATPHYQWYVNSVPVGTGADTLHYAPANLDVVSVMLTSSAPCLTIPGANAAVPVLVDSAYVPVVTVTASPSLTIAPGQYDTLVAVVTGAGPAPQYQWYRNNVPVAGATNAVYISNLFNDNDSMGCRVTGTGICAYQSFNTVRIRVKSTQVQSTTVPASLTIAPNPNTGSFYINGTMPAADGEVIYIAVTNMLGQTVYQKAATHTNGQLHELVKLGNDVANGMYTVSISNGSQQAAYHIIVAQ